jgi:hypothetical protein
MSQHRITLPAPLADWIDEHWPELRGVRTIKVYACSRLPFQWIWDRRARYSGLGLWNRIYLTDPFFPLDPGNLAAIELLFHELTHVMQWRRNPLLGPLQYLWRTWRDGYRDNAMEVEARAQAARLIAQYRQDIHS